MLIDKPVWGTAPDFAQPEIVSNAKLNQMSDYAEPALKLIGAYDSTLPYRVNDLVTDASGALWRSLVADNVDNPLEAGDYWALLNGNGNLSDDPTTEIFFQASGSLRAVKYGDSVNHGGGVVLGHARGTKDEPEALEAGDRLGVIVFEGHDGDDLQPTAQIVGRATEDQDSGNHGAVVEIEATPDGAEDRVIVGRLGAPVAVAYASTVTPDLLKGNGVFNIGALTGNITIANPTGTPFDGQIIEFRIKQDATGGRTITAMGSAFRATSACDNPPALSSGADKLDRIYAEWVESDSKWDLVEFNPAA